MYSLPTLPLYKILNSSYIKKYKKDKILIYKKVKIISELSRFISFNI
jgi:hypothetical protein